MVVENLRIHCRPPLPVVVRPGITGPENDGFCVRKGDKFLITIDDTLRYDGVLNTLLHEWAHALAWNYLLERASKELAADEITAATFEDISHGPEFGVAFAFVWRTFVKKILPTLNMHAR